MTGLREGIKPGPAVGVGAPGLGATVTPGAWVGPQTGTRQQASAGSVARLQPAGRLLYTAHL